MAPLSSDPLNPQAVLLGASFGVPGDGIVTTAVSSGHGYARSVVVQADGRILAAGSSNNGSDDDFALVRYNGDGSIDTSFGGGDGIVVTPTGLSMDVGRSVALQADGRILVTGDSYNGSYFDGVLVRYQADGSLDTSFGGGIVTMPSNGPAQAQSVAVQADGRILVAGTGSGGGNTFLLLRYEADGSLDTSFGDGDGIVTTPVGALGGQGYGVTVQADGRILVAGYSHNGSNTDFALVRYEADGSLDTSFGDGDGIVATPVGAAGDMGYSVTVQADGRILVAGSSNNGSDDDFALVRYRADGSLDRSFGGGDGIVTTPVGSSLDWGLSIALQADGRILVAGLSSNGTDNDFALVRYLADGSLDTGFGGDGIVVTPIGPGDDQGYSVTVQADGRILVAGSSSNGTDNDFTLVRYNNDGSLDTSFDARGTLGGIVAYTEGGPAVVLDPDVDLIDAELDALNGGLGDYSGASLTLARVGGADAQDLFGFAASGGFSVAGDALLDSGGNAFATLVRAGGQLTVAFAGAGLATSALVDTVLRTITYANASDRPPASVEIDWAYSGATTATGTGSVMITATNDAPVALPSVSNRQQRSLGGESNFLFSDPDGDSLTLSRIAHGGVGTDVAASGTTSVEGEYGTLTVQADGRFRYNAGKEGGLAVGETQADSFTFTIRDPAGLSATSTYTVRVTGSATGNASDNLFLVQDANRAIDGGAGTDTVSFERLGQGVTVTLDEANASTVEVAGSAFGTLRNVENLTGSAFDDTLVGDGHANRLIGNGGADSLDGGGGNDRLVISSSPTRVDGGSGTDLLFVQGGGQIVLTEESFANIEAVYVRNGTSLGLSGVETDSVVASQSTLGHSVSITGGGGDDRITGSKGADILAGGAGNDRIVAGSGGASIEGGTGADKLFGGDGADTFHFASNSGRDNLYRFKVGIDRIDVSAFVDSYDDIRVTSIHGGTSALVTFVGDPDPTHRIIVHDVQAASLTDASFLIDL